MAPGLGNAPVLAHGAIREPIKAPSPRASPPRPPLSFAHGSSPSAVYNTPTHKPCGLPARLRSLATWAVDKLAQVSVRDYTRTCRLRRQSGPSRALAQSRRYFLLKKAGTESRQLNLSTAFSRAFKCFRVKKQISPPNADQTECKHDDRPITERHDHRQSPDQCNLELMAQFCRPEQVEIWAHCLIDGAGCSFAPTGPQLAPRV